MRQSKTLLTVDEQGSEIATTSVFACQWACQWATKASKTLFLTIFGIHSSKILTLSIADYDVWIRCTLHDVTVDIFTYNWIKLFESASKESIEQWRYNILFP